MSAIAGRDILADVRRRCERFREDLAGKKTSLIKFMPPPEADRILRAKYRAAEISATEKLKNFSFLTGAVEYRLLDENTNIIEFRQILNALNRDRDTVAVIVQNPIPLQLLPALSLLSPEKDLDGMLENNPLFPAPATSEAIARLVQSFALESSAVAVVGGRGFVGRGVIRLLEKRGINCFSLDVGDDLLGTWEADIVVSATGQPELLDERHLKPYHRLVVDAGFVPIGNNIILGDVKRSACDIVQNITPVPGGVGPLQMATLLERLVTVAAGRSIEPWTW